MNLLRIEEVTSFDQPGLSPYKTLRRPDEHIRNGIFVAEGEKVVRRLLATSLEVKSILLTQEWFDKLRLSGALDNRGSAIVYVAGKNLVESIVGFNLHQGIMAVAVIPELRTLEEIVRNSPTPSLFLALDGLVNAENVGVVVRNCAAFGVHAVIVGETSSSPYLRRAVRNSMGALFDISVYHAENLCGTLRELKTEYAFSVVATVPGANSSIAEVDYAANTLIMMGNEGDGISPEVLAECTSRVGIPMHNGTDSLNVGSASAVFLYEAQRQRSAGR